MPIKGEGERWQSKWPNGSFVLLVMANNYYTQDKRNENGSDDQKQRIRSRNGREVIEELRKKNWTNKVDDELACQHSPRIFHDNAVGVSLHCKILRSGAKPTTSTTTAPAPAPPRRLSFDVGSWPAQQKSDTQRVGRNVKLSASRLRRRHDHRYLHGQNHQQQKSDRLHHERELSDSSLSQELGNWSKVFLEHLLTRNRSLQRTVKYPVWKCPHTKPQCTINLTFRGTMPQCIIKLTFRSLRFWKTTQEDFTTEVYAGEGKLMAFVGYGSVWWLWKTSSALLLPILIQLCSFFFFRSTVDGTTGNAWDSAWFGPFRNPCPAMRKAHTCTAD